MSISHHFYRKWPGLAILALVLLVAGASVAQSRKKQKGPRALAVVELPADAKSRPRLIPIAILVDGRFWDASIYLADPRPLALDPGNVYEVERTGKPVGFFTVSEVRQMKERWIAFGDWQPESEKPAAVAKAAKSRSEEDDERPVLHRRQPSTPTQEAHSAAEVKPAPAPPPVDDPNRPVLRRGKPKPQPQEPQEEDLETGSPSKPKAAPHAAPFKAAEVLAAISDAGGPEPRPYTYAWAPDEQQKLTKAISDIATAEVARYARTIPALRFAPAATFNQVVIRVFDLDYDNSPEVVFRARVPAVGLPATHRRAAPSPPAPDFFFYVTVVGQPDLYGQMRKLFSSVTDSAHLDVFPRLELIDAVDAEGTGRGDLLFRAAAGDTPSYQLYHVGPDSLRKLFDSTGE
jgi:hypothetical protein